MEIKIDTQNITIQELRDVRRFLTKEIKRRELDHKKFIVERGL